ncbi:MAG: hypothetical protein AAFX99_27325 [Myxococcota bacterium]
MRTHLHIHAALLVLGLIAWVPVAQAHDFEARHRAIVTARPLSGQMVAAQVLLMMEIPPGTRATRLIRMYDFDRSGSLSALESQMAAGTFGAEAVGGYVLNFHGRAVSPGNIQATASLTRDGGMIIALLMDYQLNLSSEKPHRLTLHVLPRDEDAPRRSKPILVEMQAEPGLTIVSAVRPVAPDAPVVGPMEVRPGGPGCWMELLPVTQPPTK